MGWDGFRGWWNRRRVGKELIMKEIYLLYTQKMCCYMLYNDVFKRKTTEEIF